MRYSRIAEDLKLDEKDVMKNLDLHRRQESATR